MAVRSVVIEQFLTPAEVLEANACWPAASWPGWVRYDERYEAKAASDLQTPVPPLLSAILARMAQAGLGAILGMPESVADLGLHGGGLHAMPPGAGLARHLDADRHPRLGLARAWSAALWVHPYWGAGWGGELEIDGAPRIEPRPGRLAAFDSRDAAHAVAPVRCPAGCERRSLALFGFLPAPGEGRRPRAVFEHAAAAGR